MDESTENVLIEASAGTGKTEALAERLITLIRAGVKPWEIVALTFSRDAAGEIFQRFVTNLARSAEKNPSDLCLLREVIATQHLSRIGTLDSFLMLVLRGFPLELGLMGDLEIMDEYRSACERNRVSFGILRRTDAETRRIFVEAFSLAMNRTDVRSFVNSYRSFIEKWHEHYLEMPDPACWRGFTAEDPGVVTVENPALQPFFEWAKGFRGSFEGLKGIAKKLVEKDDVFEGATIEVSFRNKPYAFAGIEAKAIRETLRHVYGMVIRLRSETAQGICRLIAAYERVYDEKVRRAGRLVFVDVPRLVSRLSETDRLALEFRMDARIRAWALDEFQDTSREQWRALSNLVDEAKQSDGEKSVFVVGDRKQAIYGWRNGDVRIFERERDGGAYRVDERGKTYRFGPALVEAVNRIFVDGGLKYDFPAWSSPVHSTAKPDLDGFVQKVESPGPKMMDFVDPVFNALRAVDPVRRGISTAVLVRNNAFGRLLAEELAARGLENVVWEGESDLLDTPALVAFLDLVRLADHPGDRQSYAHFTTTPLAAAKYPNGVPDAAVVSAEFALSFTTRGLVRTFRELRALLPEDPSDCWSERTEERFTAMLRAAAGFELTMESRTRLSDFPACLAATRQRTIAQPGKIRILTIHRSKGLSFDYVVLPLYEHEGITAASDGPLIGDGWILPDPGMRAIRAFPELAEASRRRQDRSEQEELCGYYVAMTRARRAMTIVLHPQPAKETDSRRFSDYVRSSLPDTIGNPRWYLGQGAPLGQRASCPLQLSTPASNRRKRQAISRSLPSLSFHAGQSAGELFAFRSVRRQAMEKGLREHARYERLEWIAAEEASTELERALVKPVGLVELWRERPFEVWVDGSWVSGRFDRVVFAGGGAEILDFKTNAIRRGETAEEFAWRMGREYERQMATYRQAVSLLTGIPLERISAKLLLTSTGQVVRK